MNSFLLSVAALLVLILSAAFIGPHFIDWNSYRDVFEAHASRMLGRAVQIAGPIELTVLPTPVLSFQTVRLADEQGGFEKPLAEVRSFTAWLSVPPLLRGAVEAREIDLEQPVVHVGLKEDGAGTWSGLGRGDASLPFIATSVALESVKINDGSVTIDMGAGSEPIALDGLNGELSARSLEGPYKFAGIFAIDGKAWELRFATGRREADGGTRLKGALRDAEWQKSYAVDGVLAGFTEVPNFKGHLLARFAPEGGRLSDETKLGPDAGHDAALEVKADVDAGLLQASLDNIEATLRRNAQPHTVNGSLKADWRNALALDVDLAARWFDLDVLVGASAPQPPLTALAALAHTLGERAATLRDGRLRVAIDQAVLGGDIIKGLKLDVAREGGGLRIAKLSGEAPGENAIDAAGVLAFKDKQAFNGQVAIRGQRLSRLLRWSGAEITTPAGTEAGDYSFDAQVAIEPGGLALEQVKGDALGTAFSGGLRYRSGARSKFDLTFASERLDLERLLGSEATFSTLRGLFASTGTAKAAPAGAGDVAPATPWLERADAKIDLNIGAVQLPKLGQTSVKTQLQLIDGNLVVEGLHLATAQSLQVQAEGRLDSVARQPQGLLTLNVKSAEAAGLAGLAGFLELPEALTPPARLKALSPLNLAVKLESKSGADRVLEATIGGSVGTSIAGATITFAGDVADFAAGTLDAAATLGNPDGKTLLAQLFPRLGPTAVQRFGAGKGLLGLKAKGVPGQGLDAHALIDAAGLRWTFDGEAKLADAALDATGAITFKAKTVAGALALIGVGLGEGAEAAGLDLAARVAKSGDAYDITGLKGQIAGETVQGKLRLELAGAKPKFDAIWAVSEASLPKMLGPVVDWQGTAGADAVLAQAIGGGSDLWPDKRFDAALLDAFDGQIVLTAQKLRLADAIVVSDATVEAELSEGALDLQTIKGGLYDGAFEASAKLVQRGSAIGFTGKAAAKGVKLDLVTAREGAKALAGGTADFDLSLVGEGLSPRGLVAGLTGDGKLTLSKGNIHGLSPAVLSAFAEARPTQAAPSEQELEKRVSARFEGSDFAFAPVTVAFMVRNGTVRFERATLNQSGATATVATYLELASLKLDSEWVLESNKLAVNDTAPQVTVVFSGPLTDFGHLSPSIDAQALEHYITMRRLEQDVERLEELDLGGRRGRNPAPPLPERRLPLPQQESAKPVPAKPVARRTPPAASVEVPSQPSGPPTRALPPAAATPPAPGGTTPSLPLRARPLRTEPAPNGAPAQPPSSVTPGRADAPAAPQSVPLPERAALAPAAGPAAQPSVPPSITNALPPQRGEVLPWQTETRTQPGVSDQPASAPDATDPLADGAITAEPVTVIPRLQRPARRQPVPAWQAEVFGQPSN